MLSCKFYKILKNNYFVEHLQTYKLLTWIYLLYSNFGTCLRGEKMFTLKFTKEAEKVRFLVSF